MKTFLSISLIRRSINIMTSFLLIFIFLKDANSQSKFVDATSLSGLFESTEKIPVIVTLNVDNWTQLSQRSANFRSTSQSYSITGTEPNPDEQLAASINVIAKNVKSSLPSESYDVRKIFTVVPAMALSISQDALESLMNDPHVLSIHEDKLSDINQVQPYNNSAQSPFVGPAVNDSSTLIGAENVWNEGYTGEGVHVAILDTGLLSSHEMFAGKNIVEACFSPTSTEYQAASICPNGEESQLGTGSAAPNAGDHGTHVAGIATGFNKSYSSGEALKGIAPDADVIAIQVFSVITSSSICGTFGQSAPCYLSFDSAQIAALEFVYNQRNNYTIGAVNLSLGGGAYDSYCDTGEFTGPIKTIIDQLKTATIPTVIATGNSFYCGAVGAPSCISSAISVGATDKNDVQANYSNFSSTIQDVFAPGSDILSATTSGNSSYVTKDGTSMATPHVAGSLALLKQAFPTASVDSMESALKTTGTSVSTTCSGISSTMPRINVDLAYESLAPCTSPSAPLGINYPTSDSDGSFTINWSSTTNASGYTLQRSTNSSFTSYNTIYSGSGTFYNQSSLVNGTYYYRVRANNSCGSSSWKTGTAIVISTCSVPSAPISITYPVSDNDGSFSISWASASGAISYDLERSTSLSFDNVVTLLSESSATSSDQSGLTNGTYYYRVRANNSCGSSSWSIGHSIIISIPCVLPTGIAAWSRDTGPPFSATWDYVENATSYTVDRATLRDSSNSIVVYSGSLNSFTDSNNLPVGFYWYRGRANNSCGSSSWLSIGATVVCTEPPDAPASINYSVKDEDGNFEVSWPLSKMALYYRVHRSTSPTFETFTWVPTLSSPVQNSVMEKNLPNGTYYYRVRSYNGCGYGEWRTGHPVTICQSEAPAIISYPTNTNDGNFVVSWSSITDAIEYTLERSTSLSFDDYSVVYVGTLTSYSHTDLGGGRYYFRVRATNNCTESDWTVGAAIDVQMFPWQMLIPAFTQGTHNRPTVDK